LLCFEGQKFEAGSHEMKKMLKKKKNKNAVQSEEGFSDLSRGPSWR
jgi:hypothetical protein